MQKHAPDGTRYEDVTKSIFSSSKEELQSIVPARQSFEMYSDFLVKEAVKKAMVRNIERQRLQKTAALIGSWCVLFLRSISERLRWSDGGRLANSGKHCAVGIRQRGHARLPRGVAQLSIASFFLLAVAGCQELPPPPKLSEQDLLDTPEYAIAPLDTVQIFVWRAPDLSVTVPVRPDGRITIPLVEDLMAAGKSPTVLARDIEEALRPFVQDPKASVVLSNFANQTAQMIKVIGEVAQPVTLHYQMHMSVLDVLAEAKGLTEYADGNDAKLIRKVNGRERTYQLKLNDLLDDGRMSANAKVRPGDLIVVPKSLL